MAKNYVNNLRGEVYFTPSGNLHIKDEPLTPIEDDFGEHNCLNFSYENDSVPMRKSLSMNDIAKLKNDFVKLEHNNTKQDVYNRHYKQSNLDEMNKTKFVSMAEAIYHFQRDTPQRFHTIKPQSFRPRSPGAPSGLTVPQSPMLRCKARSRPHHILTLQEKEEMELEEIKKFKLKANPVPKSVIEGPTHLPDVIKKPVTVPEPFHLTEIHRKTYQSPEQPSFKARPAPKHILEKSKVPLKLAPNQLNKPKSPKFHYKRSHSADHLAQDLKKCTLSKPDRKTSAKCEKRQGPVRPEPFSFEKRDEELKRRREERIKRQLEEERKLANQFKAHPLPAVIKKRMHNAANSGGVSNASSENKENYSKFEAKPPVVLYKEPFKPVLKPVQLVKPLPFELFTEKRASEREKFDKLIKEKEEENEKIREQRKREQLEAEEKAVAELREKMVHHAKPVPSLDPFVPEKSVVPITIPETPKFVRRLKQH